MAAPAAPQPAPPVTAPADAPVTAPANAAHDLRRLWWASTSDALGSQASGVVLPLLLLGLGYPVAVVGALAGAATGAGLLLGPLAAIPADRGARKAVLVWSAAASAAAMTAVAVTVAAGRPPLAVLLGLLLVERCGACCYQAALGGTVAALCAPPDYPTLTARLQAGEQGALVLGPALGGLLYQLARAWPFAADAGSYAITALCVRSMRDDLRAGSPGRGPAARAPRGGRTARALAEATAGARLVRGTPLLRTVLVWVTAVNLVLAALYYGALFVLERGGYGGAVTGAVLAGCGAAGIAGALGAPAAARRIGGTRTVLAVTWLLVPLSAAMALGGRPLAFAAPLAAVCLLVPSATVVLQSRAIHVVPGELRARASAVLTAATGAAAALGPVAAGAVGGALPGQSGRAALALGCAALLGALALYTGWVGPRSLELPAAGPSLGSVR
ncbi:MFS transporter [Streptacidiphilus sp. P02-A3a]|nr:MFS transporter [Streptacidiphilus sp. P02-A3a]